MSDILKPYMQCIMDIQSFMDCHLTPKSLSHQLMNAFLDDVERDYLDRTQRAETTARPKCSIYASDGIPDTYRQCIVDTRAMVTQNLTPNNLPYGLLLAFLDEFMRLHVNSSAMRRHSANTDKGASSAKILAPAGSGVVKRKRMHSTGIE